MGMIKKTFRGFRNFLHNKPLSTITAALAAKDAVLGLGFILAPYEVTQTLLYQNVAALIPAALFGWALLIVGLVTATLAVLDKTKRARVFLEFMALFWLFGAFTYLLAGAPMLTWVGAIFTFLPGYISFYYKNEGLRNGEGKHWFPWRRSVGRPVG